MNRLIVIVTCAWLGACTTANVPAGPRQGVTPAGNGGLNGYQHGVEGSLFALGGHSKRIQQFGYLKQVGDEGVFAINLNNGSAFGIPNSTAPGLRSGPFGKSPEDHDGFVRAYFIKLGLPADQVTRVRTMTMLEASGRSDETQSTAPAVTAYYSVLDRAVDGISVPDSFAWARVNAEGKVVGEGVYWPPLSAEVMAGARRLRDTLADPSRRSALASRIAGAGSDSTVAIRHASAWIDAPFEAFPCLDVAVVSRAVAGGSPVASNTLDTSAPHASPTGQVVVRHIDADGVERFLPQERRNLGNQFASRPHQHPK
jgi:hypothetical protein